jgi:hypothetical protein
MERHVHNVIRTLALNVKGIVNVSSSNERYHCPEKDCDIVPSGLHGTYLVCRKCKMEVTEKLRIQKIEEKKNPAPKPKKYSEIDLDAYMSPELEQKMKEAFEELLLTGSSSIHIDDDMLFGNGGTDATFDPDDLKDLFI